MRRLFVQIYLMVLGAIVVFALIAAGLWWVFVEQALPRHPAEAAVELAQTMLPEAAAPLAAQQAALERMAARLGGDLALYSADGARIAQAGRSLPPPGAGHWRGGMMMRRGEGMPLWTVPLGDGRALVARISPREFQRARRPGALLVIGLIALAVGAGAYPVVRRMTRRLETLKSGVEALGAGELAARVRVEGRDEVAALAESFNRAAARIEELVGAHKTLLANASHELRTPLARIRMALELIERDAEPRRKADLARDIAELDSLIEEILVSSRLEGARQVQAEPVDLLAIAAEECARYEEAELDGEPVSLRGDPRLLRRMIRNLLENARRHGAPPTELRVSRSGKTVEVSVCDHGPGVPEPERERVFEPFYRRSGSVEGAGLGLALVRQIARRHGGEAACHGNCFRVSIPA